MDTGHRRRRLLLGGTSLAGALVLALTGCDFFSTDPAGEDGGSVEASGEAPMLAEMVEAGELPPLEERLPENPVVVEPHERIGVYGGEWRTAINGIGDWPWLGRTVGYDSLMRWDTEWEEVIPNLAESWEYNDDATELTYHLREGLRWSDGEPFTAEDIVFALNDVYNNPEISDVALSDPGEAELIDDHTFTITFPEPRGKFASHDLLHYQLVSMPKHYLEQFHAEYNEDAEELAEEEGYESWQEMFNDKSGAPIPETARRWQNPEIPTMNAWMVVEPLADSGEMVLERNPYYWKVDTEGNQLPYIDRVVFDVIQDNELMLTQALAGEINMHTRHFNTVENRPVVADGREEGNYELIELVPSEMNTNIVSFNLTHEDETLREIFNDKDFRIAMSHAINRQEIIDVVYAEQGEPWQAAPRAESPFYDEEFAKQYTEYDVDLANEMLDDAGYEMEGDTRVGPDGEPISFNLTVASGFRDDQIDAMEMVEGYWQEVGIDVQMETENRDLFQERRTNNEHDVNVWSGDNGGLDAIYDSRWYLPMQSGESLYAIPWAQWLVSDGDDERGQEPPDDVKDHFRLWDEDLQESTDLEEQIAVMEEILAISKEQFYTMGVSLTPPGYGIVANNFHNVPESMPEAAVYNTPGPTNPEQYFIEG